MKSFDLSVKIFKKLKLLLKFGFPIFNLGVMGAEEAVKIKLTYLFQGVDLVLHFFICAKIFYAFGNKEIPGKKPAFVFFPEYCVVPAVARRVDRFEI